MKALIGDDPSVMAELLPAVEQYNKEQLVAVRLPGAAALVRAPRRRRRPRADARSRS